MVSVSRGARRRGGSKRGPGARKVGWLRRRWWEYTGGWTGTTLLRVCAVCASGWHTGTLRLSRQHGVDPSTVPIVQRQAALRATTGPISALPPVSYYARCATYQHARSRARASTASITRPSTAGWIARPAIFFPDRFRSWTWMGERSKVVPRSSRNPGGPGLCTCSRGKRICRFVPLLETVQEEEEEDDARVRRDHVPAIARASNKSFIVLGRRYRSCSSINGNRPRFVGGAWCEEVDWKQRIVVRLLLFRVKKKKRRGKKKEKRTNQTNLRLLISDVIKRI